MQTQLAVSALLILNGERVRAKQESLGGINCHVPPLPIKTTSVSSLTANVI